MSFVQRGVDMVNERLNRVKGSPEQKPAEFPAEVPLTIDEGRGPAPSLPSTSSSLPAAGDARGVLGVPGGAPTRSESPLLMQDAEPGVPAQPRPPSIPLSSIPLVASEIDDAHGPSADEIHGLDDMLWLLREPGEVVTPMDEEDDDWVSSIASSIASYDRSADESLNAELSAMASSASTIDAVGGGRVRPPSAGGGPPPARATMRGVAHHKRSISEPVGASSSLGDPFGPMPMHRGSSAEELFLMGEAGAGGGAPMMAPAAAGESSSPPASEYPAAGANEITSALWALTRRYETYYDAGPGSPMKAQRIEQRRATQRQGKPPLAPLQLPHCGAPPPTVASDASSVASHASSVASAATTPTAAGAFAHASVAPVQPIQPPPLVHGTQHEYEFEPPPRYKQWRPNRVGFHKARAEWFLRQTGRELTGTVAEQDRAVNAWARRYRGKTQRGASLAALSFGAAIGAPPGLLSTG